jgi:transcriptional regulator with XRE-family HTH domain
MTTKIENPVLQSFREFVKTQAAKRNLSMRKLSLAIGMTPSYFSEILNGKKKINNEFLNSLADYLEIPRVDVYQAAGLIQLGHEDLLDARVQELRTKDPMFKKATDLLAGLEQDQMENMIGWMLLRVLDMSKRGEAASAGDAPELQELLKKLTPEEQAAFSKGVKMMFEAYKRK